MSRYQEYIRQCRANASHGEFFFAKFILPNGVPTERPVFVISDDNDKNDVIICVCTKHPPRDNSDFDYPVIIRGKEGSLRTNKVYTVEREQLLNPIGFTLDPDDYSEIINKIKDAIRV